MDQLGNLHAEHQKFRRLSLATQGEHWRDCEISFRYRGRSRLRCGVGRQSLLRNIQRNLLRAAAERGIEADQVRRHSRSKLGCRRTRRLLDCRLARGGAPLSAFRLRLTRNDRGRADEPWSDDAGFGLDLLGEHRWNQCDPTSGEGSRAYGERVTGCGTSRWRRARRAAP